jgi:uncharacterized protein YtpQ (UPF0354 family)
LGESGDGRDRDSIVPVVKRAEPEGYGNPPPPSMTPDEFPIFEDLTPYLIVGYAFDFPDHFVFVSRRHCERLELDPCDLRSLAVRNLTRRRAAPQLKALPGAVMLVVGGDMEASLLLVDHLWTQIGPGLAGDLIAAVPARDILLVTGSEVPGGRERLQRGIETTWRKSETRILLTKALLYRDGNAWRH